MTFISALKMSCEQVAKTLVMSSIRILDPVSCQDS